MAPRVPGSREELELKLAEANKKVHRPSHGSSDGRVGDKIRTERSAVRTPPLDPIRPNFKKDLK